ncbi:Carbohydrate sulfotransferase 11 [Nymphon striatum]|nr:Carbohydrate sulfotransferase 11 [Nymphon striatum]
MGQKNLVDEWCVRSFQGFLKLSSNGNKSECEKQIQFNISQETITPSLSPEKIVEIVENENRKRLNHLHEICEAYTLPNPRSQMKSTKLNKGCHITDCPVFVEERYNFLYCNIAKVACSTFKNELLKLAGLKPPNTFESLHPYADSMLHRVSPNYFNDTSNFTMFMFVRHPFDRLVSAFHDKADVGYNEAYLISMWAPIIKKYRKVENITKGLKPTFREFVLHLIDTPATYYNEHWLPFWFRCAPCTANYDFIGKIETFYHSPLFEEVKASLAKLRHLIDAQELADQYAELKRNAELKDLVDALFKDFEGAPQAQYWMLFMEMVEQNLTFRNCKRITITFKEFKHREGLFDELFVRRRFKGGKINRASFDEK